MNAKRILVPLDFSDASKEALRCATAIAAQSGATVFLLAVVEPPAALPEYWNADLSLQRTQTLLDEVQVSSRDLRCIRRVTWGQPADEILQMANDEQADLIVMGTHGRTGLKRLLMGSVAEAVVRRAPCPVLILKQPHAVAKEQIKAADSQVATN